MHELGIVFHIIRTVEDVAKENHVARIQRVTLQLGEVSGVVESYLQDCWKWAAAKTDLLPGAELTVETIPAVTVCEDCGQPVRKRLNLWRGYLTAVILHGFYDSCAMLGNTAAMLTFLVFVIIMYIRVYRLLRRESATDSPV